MLCWQTIQRVLEHGLVVGTATGLMLGVIAAIAAVDTSSRLLALQGRLTANIEEQLDPCKAEVMPVAGMGRTVIEAAVDTN